MAIHVRILLPSLWLSLDYVTDGTLMWMIFFSYFFFYDSIWSLMRLDLRSPPKVFDVGRAFIIISLLYFFSTFQLECWWWWWEILSIVFFLSLFLFLVLLFVLCFFFVSFFFFLFLQLETDGMCFGGVASPFYMERSFQLFLERHQPVPTLESILSSFLCIIEREKTKEKRRRRRRSKKTQIW